MRGITLRAGTAPRPGPHKRPRDSPIVRAVAESVYVEIGGGRPITKSELCAGSGFCTSEGDLQGEESQQVSKFHTGCRPERSQLRGMKDDAWKAVTHFSDPHNVPSANLAVRCPGILGRTFPLVMKRFFDRRAHDCRAKASGRVTLYRGERPMTSL